jgi:hypothetical protein
MGAENVQSIEVRSGRATRALPDDTPPRNRLIFGYTIVVVFALIGLKFVFDSYLDVSRTAKRREQIATSRANVILAEYRRAQRERLESGPMPIDRAMHELARRGRNAFAQIRPEASGDRAPLQGWQQLPRAVSPAFGNAAWLGASGVDGTKPALSSADTGAVPEGSKPGDAVGGREGEAVPEQPPVRESRSPGVVPRVSSPR